MPMQHKSPGIGLACPNVAATMHEAIALRPCRYWRPRNCHILIIADPADDLTEVAELLRGQLCRVTIAHNGWHGYYRAQTGWPDLILLGAAIRRMDGIAVCRLLQQDATTARIPFMFISHSRSQTLDAFTLDAVDVVQRPFYPAELVARVFACLRRRAARAVAVGADTAMAQSNDEALLQASMAVVSQELGTVCTSADLARRVGTNTKRLSTIFKARMGMSVHRYLVEQKMEAARRLLVSTAMPVQEIAQYLGYRCLCNFSVAFRRHMGETPSGFRKLQQARD